MCKHSLSAYATLQLHLCPGLQNCLLRPVLVTDDGQRLCELVLVLGLKVPAHIHHQLVQAGREVALTLAGLALDD